MPNLDSYMATTRSKIIFIGNLFGELTVGSIASTCAGTTQRYGFVTSKLELTIDASVDW